ncbi:MAG: hypothetical protein ABL961_18510, partial [Vicinamibacterales bacterium]
YSDRDICVFTEDVDELAMEAIRKAVAASFSTEPQSVACYRLSTVDEMVRGGSLFLWHLRLEGHLRYDPDDIAAEALAALVPYGHFRRDIARFRGVFDDVAEEFEATGTLSTFELHVLSVVTRNICMLLTVRAGHPVFGRRGVYQAARTLHPRLPLPEDAWTRMIAGHLTFMRDVAVPGHEEQATPSEEMLLSSVRQVIEFAADLVD